MHYLSVAEARDLPGLRLVLTTGVPGPWGEAAKALFKARRVAFQPVAQQAMAPNPELLEWTGHRNAPIACLDDEPPLTAWHDLLMLAERLGSGPSLLPDDPAARALAIGFTMEIAGRDGLGWNRRLEMMGGYLADDATPDMRAIAAAYGVTHDAVARAPARIAGIVRDLSGQLARQQAAGSAFLAGDRLSVLDLYWASFSMMLAPLPQAVNPMPDWLRPLYSKLDPAVEAALDPALLTHRDRVYADAIGLPLVY